MKAIVLVSKGGPNAAMLTYEAPDDAAVGDLGSVPMWSSSMGQDAVYPGVIIALGSSFAGACREFTLRAHSTKHEDVIKALEYIARKSA